MPRACNLFMAICAPERSISSIASAPATMRLVDGALLVRARARQHEVHDFVLAARMAHADAQAPESVALRGDEVAQAVVSAVAAGFLEPHRAARQIDFIVRHQHLRRRDLVETRARSTPDRRCDS